MSDPPPSSLPRFKHNEVSEAPGFKEVIVPKSPHLAAVKASRMLCGDDNADVTAKKPNHPVTCHNTVDQFLRSVHLDDDARQQSWDRNYHRLMASPSSVPADPRQDGVEWLEHFDMTRTKQARIKTKVDRRQRRPRDRVALSNIATSQTGSHETMVHVSHVLILWRWLNEVIRHTPALTDHAAEGNLVFLQVGSTLLDRFFELDTSSVLQHCRRRGQDDHEDPYHLAWCQVSLTELISGVCRTGFANMSVALSDQPSPVLVPDTVNVLCIVPGPHASQQPAMVPLMYIARPDTESHAALSSSWSHCVKVARRINTQLLHRSATGQGRQYTAVVA